MKQYIFFDLDGTLTDPMIGITSAVQYALAFFDIEVKYLKELTMFIGPPLKDSFIRYYDFSEEQAELAVKKYREYFSPTGIYENEIYDGIKDMLSELCEAGYELVLATSKPWVYARKILEHFGIDEYFSYISGSELSGERSKKEEVILHALNLCRAKPEDAVMVGDREYDIIGAKKCGLLTVGVTYGYGSREELIKESADYIVDTVKELKERLLTPMENDTEAGKANKNKGECHMVRFGMIGTGKIADKFYQANCMGRDVEFTAVYSRTMEKAAQFAAGKMKMTLYDDLDSFANSDDFDAVYLASPNCCHFEQAIKLMRAKKHVLCEKPIASNYEEAKEMFAVAEEENVILLEGMRSIYTPGFKKMMTYFDSLGTIRRATLQYCQYSSRYDNFKRGIIENAFKPELSNGALMDIGVYPVACMIRLFGAPKSVKASGIKLSNGVDGEGTILMEYDDMIGEAIYSKITDAAMPSQILGEDACMMVREIENVKDLQIIRKTVKQTIHFEQSDNTLNHETKAFVKMVKTGLGWEDAKEITLQTMKVLDEARRQMGIVFPADKIEKVSQD